MECNFKISEAKRNIKKNPNKICCNDPIDKQGKINNDMDEDEK